MSKVNGLHVFPDPDGVTDGVHVFPDPGVGNGKPELIKEEDYFHSEDDGCYDDFSDDETMDSDFSDVESDSEPVASDDEAWTDEWRSKNCAFTIYLQLPGARRTLELCGKKIIAIKELFILLFEEEGRCSDFCNSADEDWYEEGRFPRTLYRIWIVGPESEHNGGGPIEISSSQCIFRKEALICFH